MKQLNYHLIWAIPLLILTIYYGLIPTNLDILIPGGISPIEDKIVIEESYPQEGSISSVYIYSIEKPSQLSAWIADFLPGNEVEEMSTAYSYMTLKEISTRGTILYETGLDYSLIQAYLNADQPLDISFHGAYVTYVGNHDLEVEVGDLIVGVDDLTLTTLDDLVFYLEDKDEVILHTSEGEERLIFRDTDGYYHLIFRIDYDLSNAEPAYEIKPSSVEGSSGGLLQTLSLYNRLTPVDITKGLSIAGTGTLDATGIVGEIGGIRQKVIAASKAGVDIFFVPSANYLDAVDELSKISTEMVLVEAKTFQDALAYLTGDLYE